MSSSLFGFFISLEAYFSVEDARCLFTSSEPAQDPSAALGLTMCRGGRGPPLDPGTQVLPAFLAWRLGKKSTNVLAEL